MAATEKRACRSVLRKDRPQLSAVAFVPECEEQTEDTWSAGAATDPQAVAWMTAEQNAPRPHEMLIKKTAGSDSYRPGQELRRQPPSESDDDSGVGRAKWESMS